MPISLATLNAAAWLSKTEQKKKPIIADMPSLVAIPNAVKVPLMSDRFFIVLLAVATNDTPGEISNRNNVNKYVKYHE